MVKVIVIFKNDSTISKIKLPNNSYWMFIILWFFSSFVVSISYVRMNGQFLLRLFLSFFCFAFELRTKSSLFFLHLPNELNQIKYIIVDWIASYFLNGVFFFSEMIVAIQHRVISIYNRIYVFDERVLHLTIYSSVALAVKTESF